MAIPKHHLVADMPTNSFATLNPLMAPGLTLANGNLEITNAPAAYTACLATIAVSSGKWYFEGFLPTAGLTAAPDFGWNEADASVASLTNFNGK